MTEDLWVFEKKAYAQGYRIVAGVDEAGRGPLAGPVVAGAAVLDADNPIAGLDDSKKLTPKKRERLFDILQTKAVALGVGIAGPDEIDDINILQASLLAMKRAVDDMSIQPDFLLIDGLFKIQSVLPQESITKGDSRSASIAAASIIAKVTRDRLMQTYHETYPEYGFAGHKGYPTKAHKEAIRQFGSCPIHRRTFKGVKEYL
ncbi:ribonuclease HII [Thermodesulfobacteriota bacterium]